MFKTELDWVSAYKKLEAELENKEKQIATLEEKISNLLSCKKCPENKGGLLCQKEYEDKCLAQKIQFIKELQEENAELKGIKDVATLIRANNDTVTTLMQLNNKLVSKSQQLTKATELLRELVLEVTGYEEIYGYDACEPVQEAEQFLSEVEK